MAKPSRETCQKFYNLFISMDDGTWEAVDRRLAREHSAEEVEAIQAAFVAFTQFVWSNFIDLRLEPEDPVIERIIDARGADALEGLGVDQKSLEALRPGNVPG